MKICVYGGGNIAHSLAAKISLSQSLSVITRQPQRWSRRLSFEQNGQIVESRFDVVATNDIAVACDAELVFVALPQFAVGEALDALSRVLTRGATIALVPAPAIADEIVGRFEKNGIHVIGFQRVPYISRIVEYGQSVRISPDRSVHRLAFSNLDQQEALKNRFVQWFGGDVTRLSSFLTFVFNNSNPLLHPSRMVVLFRNWRKRHYVENPLFYAEWTDESSELYLAADREMKLVMQAVDPTGECLRDYEDVLTHYGVCDAKSLTEKLRSIPSFKDIRSPMIQTSSGWVPDFTSRYFTEDVEFGLSALVQRGLAARVNAPVLDRLLSECMEMRQNKPS